MEVYEERIKTSIESVAVLMMSRVVFLENGRALLGAAEFFVVFFFRVARTSLYFLTLERCRRGVQAVCASFQPCQLQTVFFLFLSLRCDFAPLIEFSHQTFCFFFFFFNFIETLVPIHIVRNIKHKLVPREVNTSTFKRSKAKHYLGGKGQSVLWQRPKSAAEYICGVNI